MGSSLWKIERSLQQSTHNDLEQDLQELQEQFGWKWVYITISQEEKETLEYEF